MSEDRPQTVGVALIAYNAEGTLKACLDSLKPLADQVVVCVDAKTTDSTKQIALDWGAEVFDYTFDDHFAQARNESFTHLRKDLDWWMWIDADDVLVNGEGLKLALQEAAESSLCLGVWLRYEYAFSNTGEVTTQFTRERILRTTANWTWRHRVHEVAVPDRRGIWWQFNDSYVKHQPHDMSGSAPRNLALLQRMLNEDDPQEYDLVRALREMGDQLKATGQFLEATAWYNRCVSECKETDDELAWWCYLQMGIAYRFAGDYDNAEMAVFNAYRLRPSWPQAPLELAFIMRDKREWDKSIAYAKVVPTTDAPSHTVFYNPLDRDVYWRLPLSDSLGYKLEIDEAIRTLLPVRKRDKGIRDSLKRLYLARRMKRNAERYSEKAEASEEILYPPEDIKHIPGVRDVWAPRLLKARKRADVVFFCGYAPEEWSPNSLATGIGGSETAVIEIAQRFASTGRTVEVYNNPGAAEGLHGQVGYWDAKRFDPDHPGGLFVAWRAPHLAHLGAKYGARVLWMHDLNMGDMIDHRTVQFDRILGVSEWHASYIRKLYRFIHPSKVDYVPNGIDLTRYEGEEERAIHRCVYSSSPDRGLDILLSLWPRIKAAVEDAELHIFYGWEGVDRNIKAGRTDLARFKESIMRLVNHLPGVVWRGRTPQKELAREQMKADVWSYPTHFVETSCITAMECQAAGTPAVTSHLGALPDVIGGSGLVIPGEVRRAYWQDKYVNILVAALVDVGLREGMKGICKARAPHFSWDQSFIRWASVIGEITTDKLREAANTVEVAPMEEVAG